MKKLFLLLLASNLLLLSARAQVPTDTADLRAKINAWIVTNGSKSITAVQVNQLLNGIANLMKANAVDSGYISIDTVYLVRRGFSTIKLKLPTGGSGGIETDPTVPAAAKGITSTDITNWNAKQNTFTTASGIAMLSGVLTPRKDSALWNALKIQGNSVASTAPVNGQVLKWNGSAWAPANDSLGSGTGGGAPANLGVTRNSTSVSITNSNGTGTTIPSADGTNAGVLSASDWTDFKNRIFADTIYRVNDSTIGWKKNGNSYSFQIPGGVKGGGGTITGVTNQVLADTIKKYKRNWPGSSSFDGVTALDVYGNSFAHGDGASVLAKGFASLLKDRYGLTLNNYAIGGTGMGTGAPAANNNYNPANGMNNGLLVHYGFNEARWSSAGIRSLKRFRDNLRSILANAVFRNLVFANNVTTKSGTWTATDMSSSLKGGKAGTFGGVSGASNNVSGSYLEQSINGDGFVLAYLNSIGSGFTGGNFTISVDGVVNQTVTTDAHDSLDDGGQSKTFTPGAVFVKGLGPGAHTIRITNNSNNWVYIDYIAEAKSPTKTAPIFIDLVPKMSAAGYAAGPWTGGSDAIFEKFDSVLLMVADEFRDYPVSVVYVNDYYNPNTDNFTDNVHPNDAGHIKLAQAHADLIIPKKEGTGNLQGVITGGNTLNQANTILHPGLDLTFDGANSSTARKIQFRPSVGLIDFVNYKPSISSVSPELRFYDSTGGVLAQFAFNGGTTSFSLSQGLVISGRTNLGHNLDLYASGSSPANMSMHNGSQYLEFRYGSSTTSARGLTNAFGMLNGGTNRIPFAISGQDNVVIGTGTGSLTDNNAGFQVRRQAAFDSAAGYSSNFNAALTSNNFAPKGYVDSLHALGGGGGGGSQTLQQVLTTGSTLTQANTISTPAFNWTIDGTTTGSSTPRKLQYRPSVGLYDFINTIPSVSMANPEYRFYDSTSGILAQMSFNGATQSFSFNGGGFVVNNRTNLGHNLDLNSSGTNPAWLNFNNGTSDLSFRYGTSTTTNRGLTKAFGIINSADNFIPIAINTGNTDEVIIGTGAVTLSSNGKGFQVRRQSQFDSTMKAAQPSGYTTNFNAALSGNDWVTKQYADSLHALAGGGSSSTLSQPQKDTINHMMDSAFNAPANSFALRNSKATGDTIFRGTSNPNQGLFKTINVTSADGTITIVKTKTDSSWAADISTAGVHDSGTPTVVANSGAGTGATVSVTGTDRRGTITVTAGTSPTAGQSICSLTFNTAYSSAPYVIIQASNTVGGSTNPIPRVSATPTTTTFSFISDPTAGLVASVVYKFTYIVVQ